MEDPDVLRICVGHLVEDAANLAAHVAREWRSAVRDRWPGGWYSDAAAGASSVERFRWAQSIGCRWRGRCLMRAAARAGSLELLQAVARRYRHWDEATTVAAAAGDHVDVVRWIAQLWYERRDGDRYPALSVGALRCGGPRVRALAAELCPRYQPPEPTRDFRRLGDGAVWVDGPTDPTEALAALRGWHLPVSTRVEQRSRWTYRHPVHIAYGWTLVNRIQALPGSRITVAAGLDYAPEAHDPLRVWYAHGMLFHQLTVWLEPDPSAAAPSELGFSFIATLVPEPPDVAERFDDGIFSYQHGMISRAYVCGPGPEVFARRDGLADTDDNLILY